MKIKKLKFKNSFLFSIEKKEDNRGFFQNIFIEKKIQNLVSFNRIMQINRSFTKRKGTVRGLHFQKSKFNESKIVFCTKGKIMDIIVNLKKNSKDFLKHEKIILSEDHNKAIFIPEGFAHGFQTLSKNCELIYLHSKKYNKNFEDGLNVLDPALGIKWPLKISNMSTRDQNFKLINKKFKGI